MNVKMNKLISAAAALRKLYNSDLTFTDARKVSKLVNAVQEELDFFGGEREKVMARYHIGSPDEDKEGWDKTMRELLGMDVDISCAPVTVHAAAGLTISASDLDALSPVIVFEEGD